MVKPKTGIIPATKFAYAPGQERFYPQYYQLLQTRVAGAVQASRGSDADAGRRHWHRFPSRLFRRELFYQMLHKSTEVFAPISSDFNKAPIETWRHYAPLFREYSTTSVSPELLAALAQAESAGNPVASTYWRFWKSARASGPEH